LPPRRLCRWAPDGCPRLNKNLTYCVSLCAG
jgi:hypothetical protein